MTIADAKERVTIHDLWPRYFEGHPSKTCYCPFHDNTNTPAFSVFDGGRAL